MFCFFHNSFLKPLLTLHCRTRLSQAFIRQRTILVGTPTLRFLVELVNYTQIPQHDSVLLVFYSKISVMSTILVIVP